MRSVDASEGWIIALTNSLYLEGPFAVKCGQQAHHVVLIIYSDERAPLYRDYEVVPFVLLGHPVAPLAQLLH